MITRFILRYETVFALASGYLIGRNGGGVELGYAICFLIVAAHFLQMLDE